MKSRKPLIPEHLLHDMKNDSAHEKYLLSRGKEIADAINLEEKEMLQALESKLLQLHDLLRNTD